jgi:hypothetical protein
MMARPTADSVVGQTTRKRDMDIDTSNVRLTISYESLVVRLAEHNHDVWARQHNSHHAMERMLEFVRMMNDLFRFKAVKTIKTSGVVV